MEWIHIHWETIPIPAQREVMLGQCQQSRHVHLCIHIYLLLDSIAQDDDDDYDDNDEERNP